MDEAIWDRFVRQPESLGDAELAHIAEALDADPQQVRERWYDLHTHELLCQTLHMDRRHFSQRIVAALRPGGESRRQRLVHACRPSLRRWPLGLGAAAAILLVMFMAVTMAPTRPALNHQGAIQDQHGQPFNRVVADRQLLIGDGGAQIRVGSAIVCELEAQSRVRFAFPADDSVAIHLDHGSAQVTMHTQDAGTLSLHSPHGTVAVTGTRFANRVSDDHHYVRVFSGNVTVSTPEQTLELPADTWTRMEKGRPLTRQRVLTGQALVVSGGDQGPRFAHRLRDHGLTVTVTSEHEVQQEALATADLVLLAPDIHYDHLGKRGVLQDFLPSHLLIGEARLLGSPLGIPDSPPGVWRRATKVRINDPGHPLAGGLTGTVQLFAQANYLPSHDHPDLAAVAAATRQQWPVMGYWHDRDPTTSQAYGRVLLPMGENAPANALPAAWYLTDLAVQWLMPKGTFP